MNAPFMFNANVSTVRDEIVPRKFTTQPTPTVTAADVERVVKRDFKKRDYQKVLDLVAKYTSPETHRIRLAILKLTDGDLGKLEHFIDLARDDYREVIMAAEYPEDLSYMRSGRPKGRRERDVWKADWEQYENWLNG